MKKKLALSILTVCSLCVFGFTHQTNAQEILKIGGIMTTSGAAAHLGQTGLNGVMMKVDEVNAQGGITVGGKNYKIKLVNYDDKCVANDAISAAQRLLNVDKVPAIVGAICSHCTLAVMEIAEKKKIPIVCPLSGSVKVTSLGYKYIFRSWGHAGLHSEAISRFAIETLKAKKIAFLGRNDAWGRSAGDQLEKRLEKQGGELIIKDFYEHGTTDFYSKLTKIKQARPDAIYFIALAEDGAMAVKQAREIGITCTLLGTDEMANEKVYGIAGDAMEGLYFYWNGGPPTDKAKEYAKKYKKRYGVESIGLDQGPYDTMGILLDAITRAGTVTDSVKIRDALAKTDYDGIRQRYSFRSDGQAKIDVWIAQIQNKKPVFIKGMDIYSNPSIPY